MKFRFFLGVIGLLLMQAAQANEVSGKQWKAMIITHFPPAFCEDDSYFRQCLKLSSNVCQKAALSATKTCLTTLKERIPTTFTAKEQATEVGTMLGKCVGLSLDLKFAHQKSADSQCADASNWEQ